MLGHGLLQNKLSGLIAESGKKQWSDTTQNTTLNFPRNLRTTARNLRQRNLPKNTERCRALQGQRTHNLALEPLSDPRIGYALHSSAWATWELGISVQPSKVPSNLPSTQGFHVNTLMNSRQCNQYILNILTCFRS